jgi:hypothetical protein
MKLTTLLLLAACTPRTPAPGDDTAPDTADSVAPADPASFSEVTAATSEAIPAVVIVDFVAEGGAGEPWVSFGPADETTRYTAVVDTLDDGSYQAVLVGCPATTDCAYTVGLGQDEDEEREITTGAGPDWAQITADERGAHAEGFVLTVALTEVRGALILDMQGRLVWWWALPDALPTDLTSRLLLAPDGRSLWFNRFTLNSQAPIEESTAALVQVALDGSWEQIHPIVDSHHDFYLLDDGGLVYLGLEDREVEGELIRGGRLVHRDADGVDSELWNAWEVLTWDPENDLDSPPTYWTLLNHLERDPATGDWIFSVRNLATLIRIDGDTGEQIWRIGKEDPTHAADATFAGQHGLALLDDGLLVFDNSGDPVGSRVLEFTIDDDAGTATTTWSHASSETSIILGDAARLDDGNTLIAWGQGGSIEEVAPDGTLLNRLTLTNEGRLFPVGFIEYRESIGPR